MGNKRIRSYWLVLLALLVLGNLITSVGQTQAHYVNTTVWNTVVEPMENVVSSDYFVSVSDAPLTVLLGDMTENEYLVVFDLESTADVTGTLTWSVDKEAFLDVEMSINGKALEQDGKVELAAGTSEVGMNLSVTEKARTTVHEKMDINVTVNWNDSLQSTFRVTLPGVEEEDIPIEETPTQTGGDDTDPKEESGNNTENPQGDQGTSGDSGTGDDANTGESSRNDAETGTAGDSGEGDAEAEAGSGTQTAEHEAASISEEPVEVPAEKVQTTEPTPTEGAEAASVQNDETDPAPSEIVQEQETGDAPVALTDAETVTDPPATDPPATDPPATDPPTTDPPATEPPATDPPTTDPPATDPPATDPPATDPPATDPPATDPPATDPPATEPPATEPIVGEGEQLPLETISSFLPNQKVPLKFPLTKEVTQVHLGMGTASDARIKMEQFWEKTRYSLDGGNSYYMLYFDNIITVDTSKSTELSVLLDFSCVDSVIDTNIILTAQSYAGRTPVGSGSASVAFSAESLYQMENRFLTQETPMVIFLSQSWKPYTFEYTVERLSVNAENSLPEYVPVDFSAFSVLNLEEENCMLVFAIDEVLPPAGTYRVKMRWSHEGICFAQEQTTFFINYSVYSESEVTGGTEQ